MQFHGRDVAGASVDGPTIRLATSTGRMSLPARAALGVLVSLALMLGAQSVLGAASARADPLITIKLTNAPSYCLNRDGGTNSLYGTVFLFTCSSGNDTWYEGSAEPYGDPNCDAANCVIFMDPNNESLCFALGDNETGTLRDCSIQMSHWLVNGTVLRNSYWAADLFTNNDVDRATLSGDPQPIDWHQWSGP
jgi:hypothetical protein